MGLGEVLIVAPRDQQTSIGRAFRGGGVAELVHYEIDGKHVRAFAVAATPAVTVRYAVLLLADRPPALIVSGINYGENVGNGVTISGTLGASLEAAALKFPTLAVSLSVDKEYHHSHSETIDFTIAADWGKRFARRILRRGIPRGADIVNLNVPEGATLRTPYRWTKVSRMNYYRSVIKETPRGPVIDGYDQMLDPRDIEPDSDIRAVLIDRVVSVSFLTIDLTAPVSEKERTRWWK
jgi:5'-nucleotidase